MLFFGVSLAAPVNQSFTYDAANRLTTSNAVSYDMDLAGNLREISGSATPLLSLPSTSSVGASAQSGLSLSVTSNVTWTASSSQPWLTITNGTSGSGNGTIAFSVTANAATERSAIIKVTQQAGALSSTCTVTQAAAPPLAPNIVVEQGGVVPNQGTRSFGGVTVGSSASLTFTVRNTGPGNLTGLAVSKSGTHDSDFAPGSLGKTTLTANDSTTFTVIFSPGATGSRSASIRIASNDSNENPYHVNLTGTGTTTGSGGTPGAQDTSFGDGGKVVTGFGANSDSANAVAVQDDDKIIVVGHTSDGTRSYFALARYLPDGTLDGGFGSEGKVTTVFGDLSGAYALAIQNDGKIVVAGSSDHDFAVARYFSNGTLDDTFGSGGKTTTRIGIGQSRARGIALQSDGKILVAGENHEGFVLARYNTNGALDNGFGTGGKVTVSFTAFGAIANSVAVQDDGRIIVVGCCRISYSDEDVALARFNADGSLDSGFGTGGKVITPIGTSYDNGTDVALQGNGKIVVGGFASDGEWNDFAVVRYNANGTLDTGFGTGGKVTTPVGGFNDVGQGIVLQSDGKIVVAGFSWNGSDYDFSLVRYNPGGSLDTEFGSSGKTITPLSAGDDLGTGVALQSDNRIVVAGSSKNGGNTDFALVRYMPGDVTPATPTISLSGDLDFGDAQVGQTPIHLLTVSNTGSAALEVTGIDFPEGFSLAASVWVYPMVILPGDSTVVPVGFSPSSVVPYGGDLTVYSNSVGSPHLISASGKGIPYVPPAPTILSNGVPLTGLSSTPVDSGVLFRITVPSDQTQLTISTSGGTGNTNPNGLTWMYVRHGAPPTWDAHDRYLEYSSGTASPSERRLEILNPAAGDYYLELGGDFTGVSLTATYTGPGQSVKPTVTTAPLSNYTQGTAEAGGNVTSSGGDPVTLRGVVYGTAPDPTLENATNLPAATGGEGSFTVTVVGLREGTTYFARAYATNNLGTAYGESVIFTTDTTVSFAGGIGTVNGRQLPAGDRQVFRFTLTSARMVKFTGTGATGFGWELRNASNAVIASGIGNVAVARLLFAGSYSLVLTNASATDASVSLRLDARVVAVSRPDVQVGPNGFANVGANQYTPVVQTTILASHMAVPVTGFARVGNDGILPTVLRVFGTRSTIFFRVTYFGRVGANPNANLTAQMNAGTYATDRLTNTSAPVAIRAVIVPNKALLVTRRRVGTRSVTIRRMTLYAVIRATSVSGPLRTDAATIRVNTQ